MKMSRNFSICTALMLAGSLCLTGCGSSEESVIQDTSVVVDVMTAATGTLVLSNQFVGVVAPEESVYIIPLAQGTVTETYFEVGDEVQAGDVLFQIDDSAAQLQLKQAQLSYQSAAQQADSVLTTQQESTQIQVGSSVLSARSSYENAQIQYENSKNTMVKANNAVEDLDKQIEALKKAANGTISSSEDKKLVGDLVRAGGDSYKTALGIGEEPEFQSPVNKAPEDMTEEEKKQYEEARIAYEAELAAYQAKLALYQSLTSGTDDEVLTALSSLGSAGTSILSNIQKPLENARETAGDAAYQTQIAFLAAQSALGITEEAYNTAVKSQDLTQGAALEDTKEQLGTSLSLAELGVESANLALSYYRVETPISGTVISKNVAVNGFATSASAAYVIANSDTMTVTFSVSEAVKNTLAVGGEISVERNGVYYTGVVTEVGNAVNPSTGLFTIKGTVYANGDELPSGVSVKLQVETYKAENAIIIPYDAVYYESEGAYIYVMKDGQAVKTYVTTGIFDDTNIEITSGLSLEDVVITSWSPRLIDGVAVTASTDDASAAE